MNGLIQSTVASRGAALIKQVEMPVAPFSFDGIREIYAEILAAQEEVGGTVTYRAKIPAAGGKLFEIITGNEDTDTAAQKIAGVVIHSHKCNARFKEGTLSEPPVCSSMDGLTGTELESGECHGCLDCPYNEYGSSPKGNGGKACKNMIRLYLMIEGSPIPLVLTLPPTSLNAWRNYRLSVLAPQRIKPVEVVTEFSLSPQTSKSGQVYSAVNVRLIGKLDPQAAEMARFFASGFAPKLDITADDYDRRESKEETNA